MSFQQKEGGLATIDYAVVAALLAVAVVWKPMILSHTLEIFDALLTMLVSLAT